MVGPPISITGLSRPAASRCPTARLAATVAVWVVLSCARGGGGVAVEVPLRRHRVQLAGDNYSSGAEVFVAELDIGTPPQRLLVRIDTTSQGTWVPTSDGDLSLQDGRGGFVVNVSSTAKAGVDTTLPLHGGLEVVGKEFHDIAKLGELQVEDAPLVLAVNFSGNPPPKGVGLLGLVCPSASGGAAAFSLGATAAAAAGTATEGEASDVPGSFFDAFWSQHPEVEKRYTLALGAANPSLILGEQQSQQSEAGGWAQGEVRLLANTFTSRSPLWYVSLRAIGLSSGQESPVLRWSHDFNAVLPWGAPALLDSSAFGIHIGSGGYAELVSALPWGCERLPDRSTACPCSPGSIEDDFPSISLSFESADTFRFLGLDSGADVRVCIPPSAYVRYDDVLKRCAVAIFDNGHIRRRLLYGFETIVLGEPFFKSVAVVMDLEQQQVGLGPALQVPTSVPAEADIELGPEQGAGWDEPGLMEPDSALQPSGPASVAGSETCRCADPKNWWQTGRRFSPRRVVVCLIGVSLLAAYIFFGFSPSPAAQIFRSGLEEHCGWACDWSAHDGHMPLDSHPPPQHPQHPRRRQHQQQQQQQPHRFVGFGADLGGAELTSSGRRAAGAGGGPSSGGGAADEDSAEGV